jgi:hypothetical protein
MNQAKQPAGDETAAQRAIDLDQALLALNGEPLKVQDDAGAGVVPMTLKWQLRLALNLTLPTDEGSLEALGLRLRLMEAAGKGGQAQFTAKEIDFLCERLPQIKGWTADIVAAGVKALDANRYARLLKT